MALTVAPSAALNRTRTWAWPTSSAKVTVCAGSAMVGSGLPEPNGPARSIIATRSALAPPALTAPSIVIPLARRAMSTSGASASFQEGTKLRQRAFAQRHAGRHRVAAALDQQSLDDGAAHRTADIDAGDRTARAGADAAWLKRNGKGRPAEFFFQPRGDETDDAGVPAFRRRNHH